ncbi:phenoloxidase-activating factor 2-like [Episyrphus balteatus]|uniref:phenoloxidase-activating factor 2-like n=1 Tax=Episyrphus balteatus TaxID=286459 RepID=UPI002485D338|nr:phenoloxidase-activating factor 2-like [Episyrphus balteatus]XP_055838136.1 phenoloxidase-activating factor 2-like [Episyrphus balteatus]XP_055838137.1 phenoloxidase-activating factor 2-like [Episyrphus balteatus]XP_055838138.1 phenoloxidase-activating factor 2-like [Episyrphus balteatus]XP_055838139.1 phenoloxidase-activating factor 2-like [Episyrphus balteatus]XP_055838140.1 phenoloxidase-activating factor 2-like [Episyrphus balteatus]XP_055838141.1 phenoloxidase-activating factor 2-like
MNAKLILIPIFLIGSCVGQVDQNIINEVFNIKFQPQLSDQVLKEPNFETTKQPVVPKFVARTGSSYQPCGTNKVCVRYYLCNNGKVDPYGTRVIEPRMGALCNNDLETCCDFSETTEHPVVPKFVARVRTDNSYQPCGTNKVCVRYYLCNNGKVDPYGTRVIEPRMGALCNNDLETCCDFSETLDKINLNPLPLTFGCGYRNKNGVGIKIKKPIGNETEFGEFPWMVAILREETIIDKLFNVYQCGGSLIAPTVVLTGAHCVQARIASNFKVRAGEWKTNTKTEIYPDQERQVVEMIVHEHYNKDSLYNNIALLILESPFEEAPNVNTVCLPPANMNFDMSRCFATGWGKDQFQNGKYQNMLKKIDLPVVPNAKCQENLRKFLGKFFELHSSFMCAGGERGKDTCKGDGGSPLVCPMPNNPNRYFQAGIVAWGIGCGEENVPGVYASVPQLRSWIDEQLGYKRIDVKSFTP